MSHGVPIKQVSAAEARHNLVAGNLRFTTEGPAPKNIGPDRRVQLQKEGQFPFAVIVTCSDSRVSPEILFDQALGDIFVIRTAGNVLDQVSMGSVEYAVDHLHCPLVVVLGHENCGAVKATVEGGSPPGSIGAITSIIGPSVEKARSLGYAGTELCEKAADENIAVTLSSLQTSPIIQHQLAEGNVTLAGAKYFLGSGEVVFFD